MLRLVVKLAVMVVEVYTPDLRHRTWPRRRPSDIPASTSSTSGPHQRTVPCAAPGTPLISLPARQSAVLAPSSL